MIRLASVAVMVALLVFGTLQSQERRQIKAIALGGDCKTPMGAHADRHAERLRLRAFVAEIDGSGLRRAEHVVSWPASEAEAHEVGLSLGRRLLG